MGKLFKPKQQESTSKSESNPWGPTQDQLKNIIGDLGKYYNQGLEAGYIQPTGDNSNFYADYLKGLQTNGQNAQHTIQPMLDGAQKNLAAGTQGFQDIMNGKLNYSTGDIANGAGALINNDLLQQQITAATRGDVRNFNEQTMPGIDSNANASGNINSSRTALKEAVAERGLNDRIADVSANMRGNAYQNALGMSQSTLNNNNSNFMTGLNGVNGQANNMMNFANQYMQTQQGMLDPLKQAGALQEMLQGQKQADLIGGRDYNMSQLQNYLNGLLPISGLGGVQTGTQKTPGSSMFDKMVQGAGVVAQFMGGKK